MRILKRPRQSRRKSRFQFSSGFTLAEVVIAIAILALIIAAVTPALVNITYYRFHWNEQRIAENLARNHIEYVKVQPYIEATYENKEPEYVTGDEPALVKPNDSWDVIVKAIPVLVETDETGNTTQTKIEFDSPEEKDLGIQEIQVTVEHVGKTILETAEYKVFRQEIWRE